MKKMRLALLLFIVVSALLAASLEAQRPVRGVAQKRISPVTAYDTRGLTDLPLERVSLQALAWGDTAVLAEYTFDTNGVPDPQGWYSVNRAVTQLDTFFHVANSTELDGGTFGSLLVLEGSQSLWCGVPPQATPPYCGWSSLPGYGHGWDQRFESVQFVGDTINISWKIRWDSELGQDRTYVEYMNGAGEWIELPVYGGLGYYHAYGTAIESHQIEGDIGNPGATRIRFRFVSDGAWDDEDGLYSSDGACIVDSILVIDQAGDTLCYEDFEDEPPGALATLDGIWHSTRREAPIGEYADLHDGFGVLQEDPCRHSISTMWGFFDDPAITNYACAEPTPHPEQGAVPYGPPGGEGARDEYIYNEIWSPKIDLIGSGNSVILEFDVYRDLTVYNLVFYTWSVRSWCSGCPGPWRNDDQYYYGLEKDWFRHSVEIGNHIEWECADSIQLAIGVIDMAQVWWGIYGYGTCHSHSPLIDNVRLIRIETPGPVWEVSDIDLFQDNFASDGTVTGTVRMDMARSLSLSAVIPGDSMAVTVFGALSYHDPYDPESGPAVYLHVKDVSVEKSGIAIQCEEYPESERWPFRSALDGWTTVQFDTVRAPYVPDRYCVDINDNLYTPGDTVFFYLSARDAYGNTTYWSRYTGTTDSETEVRSAPMEMTCLPANALAGQTCILYIDDFDQLGAQPYFDDAFEAIGITPDRYDVRGAPSASGNGPGGRVSNVSQQLLPYYRVIIWNSGDLTSGLIGDGSGQPEVSDDFAMLFAFLDQHPDSAGVYLSGDNIAQEWVNLTGSGAMSLRYYYMEFNLANGDHVEYGLPFNPFIIGQPGSIFDHSGTMDSLIAYGGCPDLHRFDVLQMTGSSSVAAAYQNNPSAAAILCQESINNSGKKARVALSGLSYHEIRDVNASTPACIEHLRDILDWFGCSAGYSSVCRVVPTSIDFDTVAAGNHRDTIFTITNIGGGTFSGTVSAACPHYSIISGSDYNLTPGQSQAVTIRYEPTAIGIHECTVETGLIDCPDILCTAVGDYAPVCQVEPSSIDFGTINLGSYRDTTFTIKNIGGGVLIGDIVESCDEFSIQTGGGIFGLSASESLIVAVRFEPASIGTFGCDIDTWSGSCSDVSCTGSCDEPPLCRVRPAHFDFGPVMIGESMDTTFTITNIGGGTLTGYVAESSTNYSIVSGAGAYSLAHDDSLIVMIRFEPASEGLHSCTIETGTMLCGQAAYVAGGSGGLHVVNACNPSALEPVGNYDTPGWAMEVAVVGDYAYVADYTFGLRVIDVHDPASPTSVGVVVPAGYARGVSVLGSYAFLADGTTGLRIIDISNPAAPTVVGTLETTDYAGDVVAYGDYAYVADGAAGLQVIDISNPLAPALCGSYDLPEGYAQGLAIAGRYAYVAADSSGLQIIDISIPHEPAFVGMYDTPARAYNVVVANDYAYIADGSSGLQIIDVSNPAEPSYAGSYDPGSLQGVAVAGDYAYLACSSSGLKVVDVSNPSSPVYGGGLALAGQAQDVAVTGGVECLGWGSIPVPVTLATDPEGLEFVMDAVTYASPQVFILPSRTIHTIGAVSPQEVGDTLFVFSNWSDLGAASHQITVGRMDTTFTAYFDPRYNFAVIDSIVDVPNDQGGWVRLYFSRSRYDDAGETAYPIATYDIHRRVDDAQLIATVLAAWEQGWRDRDVSLPVAGEDRTEDGSHHREDRYVKLDQREFCVMKGAAISPPGVWEVVGHLSAQQEDHYIILSPTLGDSSAVIPYSAFYISAHSTTPSVFFESPIDSGYSVDNIAPAVPTGFAVAYNTGSGNQLTWSPSPDADFQYFRVYRASDPEFIPSPATLVHSTIGTSWSDPERDGGGVYYRITALDYAGNESAPASPETVTGLDEQVIPQAYKLYQNAPNPFNPETSVRYDVPPGGGVVTLRIYDVSGKLVRTLVSGWQGAGQRTVIWNGRDDHGRRVSSGVYFYQLRAPDYTKTLKMILLQ